MMRPSALAMEAGIPIVPIVIHDAEMIASRNASTMNAGTVHVTVLPPVPTDDWTLADLGERVSSVRQQFLRHAARRLHPTLRRDSTTWLRLMRAAAGGLRPPTA